MTRRYFARGGEVQAGQPLFQIDAASHQAEAADHRPHLSSMRYRAGLDGRLALLDAQRADYAARQTLPPLKHDQRTAMVGLSPFSSPLPPLFQRPTP